MRYFKKILYPEIYQGIDETKDYFEGWYFKHVSCNDGSTICFIPGVSRNNGKKYAFIQIITGPPLVTYYLIYDYKLFSYKDKPFSIKIGENYFTKEGIDIDIDRDNVKVKGSVRYNGCLSIERSILNPNIMGVFAYMPFLECYHGVISLNHITKGNIMFQDKIIDLNGGKGYIEKDFGTSFPEKYIWIQSNNFKYGKVSLMCSIAKIPFLHTSFIGVISVLYVNGKEYRFATYNFSKIKEICKSLYGVLIVIQNKKYKLVLKALYKDGGILKAPIKGKMNKPIKESINGRVKVLLYNKRGRLIYKGIGENCGIEIVID